MNMRPCRACGAQLLWVPSSNTGKPMPLDATPQKRVVLVEDRAKVVDTYVSHFSTCPHAEFRNRAKPR